jgi:hypothetical protein
MNLIRQIWQWILHVFSRSPENPTEGAPERFFDLGVQYYVTARFAAQAQLIPVVGNLFHHSIEMLLKAELSKTHSSKQLRHRKFSHDLKRTWKEFQKLYPTKDLSSFDNAVRELHRFERIRYPDTMLKLGMACSIQWSGSGGTSARGQGAKVPLYELTVTEVDQLVDKIAELSSVNMSFYLLRINPDELRFIERDNPAWKRWFPS